MRKDYINRLEEIFFERNFEYSSQPEALLKNAKKARELFKEFEMKALQLAEDMEDGLVYDESDAILTVQSYALSAKFKEQFENEIEQIRTGGMAACY